MAGDCEPGTLLVAGTGLRDGVFDGTVVFILDSDESGTVGVVLNRFSSFELARALPDWAPLASSPKALYDGGPVSQRGAICLAVPAATGEEPPGWRRVFADVGLLNLDTPVEIADGTYAALRVFAGYTGWDAGQMAAELGFGLWHCVPALPQDPFDPDPLTLWRRVLRRQGGDLALLSTWDDDVRSN